MLGSLGTYAFSMPRDGTITSLSAYFSATVNISLTANLAVTAQVWVSATPNNTFVPLQNATVTLPTFPTALSLGTSRNAIVTGLNIPVTAQTRIVVVFSLTGPNNPLFLGGTLTGVGSAGIAIN